VELEPRTTAPAHATGAVAFVPLASLADDATFKLRDEGDVAPLAASMGRLGQLVPVELRPLPGTGGPSIAGGPRYQLVAGFRRVAAARLLQRDRVLARVHARLDEEDAWAIALCHALAGEPLLASEIEALRPRLAGLPAAWAPDLLDAAVSRAPVDPAQRERFLAWLAGGRARAGFPAEPLADEGEEGAGAEEAAAGEEEAVEVTAEELADDLVRRLWEVNQDLALVADVWSELPRDRRRELLDQLRWVAQLVRHLGGDR
jgi:ParB-like chromosome segregation protein Spo0J